MSGLRTIVVELLAVFVDEGRFAGAIVAWLVLAALVLPRLPLPHGVPPVILFAGLAAILVEGALHRARPRRPRGP